MSVQQFDTYGVWAKGDNEAIVFFNNLFKNSNLVAVNFSLASKSYVVKSNRIDNYGYVAIRMDGAKSMMVGAIYCRAKDGLYYTCDNIIRNNIVYYITGSNGK